MFMVLGHSSVPPPGVSYALPASLLGISGANTMPNDGVQLLIGLCVKCLAHEEVVVNGVETNQDRQWQMKR